MGTSICIFLVVRIKRDHVRKILGMHLEDSICSINGNISVLVFLHVFLITEIQNTPCSLIFSLHLPLSIPTLELNGYTVLLSITLSSRQFITLSSNFGTQSYPTSDPTIELISCWNSQDPLITVHEQKQ